MLQIAAVLMEILEHFVPVFILGVVAKGTWEAFGRFRAKERARRLLSVNLERRYSLENLKLETASDLDLAKKKITDTLSSLSERDLKWVELALNQKSREAGKRYMEDLMTATKAESEKSAS